MPANTTTYSFYKPTVGGDSNAWGGYLNSNWDDIDDLLDGTTPVDGIDIDGGSIDGTPIGAAAASTGAFTTITGASLTATGSVQGATLVGTTSLTTPAVNVGTNDTVSGVVSLFGHAAGSDVGGELRLYLAADHDASTEYYRLRVRQDDLIIQKNDGTDILVFDDGNSKLEIGFVEPTITRLTTGTSATHNFQANTRRAIVKQYGAGAQGGGANSGGSDHGVGGGGGAGAYLEFEIDVEAAGISSFTYTIGTGGSGAGVGNDGAAGGSTTYADGTNTLISVGGSGGAAKTGVTGMNPAAGGVGGTNNLAGLVSNITIIEDNDGAPGTNGLGYQGAGSAAGNGGSIHGGAGLGASRGSTGGAAGSAATSAGAGGGGAATLNTTSAVSGGAGFAGLMIVEEYPY